VEVIVVVVVDPDNVNVVINALSQSVMAASILDDGLAVPVTALAQLSASQRALFSNTEPKAEDAKSTGANVVSFMTAMNARLKRVTINERLVVQMSLARVGAWASFDDIPTDPATCDSPPWASAHDCSSCIAAWWISNWLVITGGLMA